MISIYNSYGTISMAESYFSELVAIAAKKSFGVADMATHGAADSIRCFLQNDFPERGVRVNSVDGKLEIGLHIKVSYGLNIAAIVKSISHKVKYVVEDATGLTVAKIDVFVDDIVG